MAGYIPRWFTRSHSVTHPSTNRAWRRVTSLIETNALPLSHATNHGLLTYLLTYLLITSDPHVGPYKSCYCQSRAAFTTLTMNYFPALRGGRIKHSIPSVCLYVSQSVRNVKSFSQMTVKAVRYTSNLDRKVSVADSVLHFASGNG